MKTKKFAYKKDIWNALFMGGVVVLVFLSLYVFLLIGYSLGMPM